MNFADLFKVFSKRTPPEKKPDTALTRTFRNRVLMRCRDLFHHSEFWDEIHSQLTYLHGRPRLTKEYADSVFEDSLAFLQNCSDGNFLDFIELIFKTQSHFQASSRANLVEDFNDFLQEDQLPYALTDFVWTRGHDGQYETTSLTSYPQVICKESDVLHTMAIQPTLELLREADMSSANAEFLNALDDYRKGDYGDCLTKCGAALESALKVICTRNQWSYQPTDTAAPLIKNVIMNSGLEAFFEQPLILVGTIRNKLSTAHGAGSGSRSVTKSKAEYAINATAAAIRLLVSEAG